MGAPVVRCAEIEIQLLERNIGILRAAQNDSLVEGWADWRA